MEICWKNGTEKKEKEREERKKEGERRKKRKKEEKKKEKEKNKEGEGNGAQGFSPPQAKKLPILKSAFLAVFTHFWNAWIAKSDSARRDLSACKFSGNFAQQILISGWSNFW